MKRLLVVAAVAAACSAAAPAADAAIRCVTQGVGITVTATVCVHPYEYCQAHWYAEENAFGTHEETGSALCVPPPAAG